MGVLAEQLYLVYCANSGLVPGSGDVPNWASMPTAQRDVWEAVATKAFNVLSERFVASIDNWERRTAVAVEQLRKEWQR